MSNLARVVLTVSTFLMSYLLVWFILIMLPLGRFDWIGSLAAFVAAILLARLAWRRSAAGSNSVWAVAMAGAAIVGAIAFCIGFFGPMILAPEANQGPLLGIFYTGPAGVLLGAVGGLLYALTRRPK